MLSAIALILAFQVVGAVIAMLVTAYTIIFVDKLVHKNKNKNKD